jgi:2-oxoisovalerate dehydrogenase E1 component subunit beta
VSSARGGDGARFRATHAFDEEVTGEATPPDVAFVLRQGRDVTPISRGAMVKDTLEAAEQLKSESISAEVIDFATLKRYNEQTVLESVAKTGRCAIVHEAARAGGFGAEIAALITSEVLQQVVPAHPTDRLNGSAPLQAPAADWSHP